MKNWRTFNHQSRALLWFRSYNKAKLDKMVISIIYRKLSSHDQMLKMLRLTQHFRKTNLSEFEAFYRLLTPNVMNTWEKLVDLLEKKSTQNEIEVDADVNRAIVIWQSNLRESLMVWLNLQEKTCARVTKVATGTEQTPWWWNHNAPLHISSCME